MSSPQTAEGGKSSLRVVKLEGTDQPPMLVMFSQLTARGLGDYVSLQNLNTTVNGTSSDNLPYEAIASCLASLMDEIRAEVNKTDVELCSLGMERSTKAARQAYLVDVAQYLRELTQCAVEGTWGGQHRAFFRDSSTSQGANRRLREVIQTLNHHFMDLMMSKGCQWQVQEEQPPEPASNNELSEDEEVDTPISSTETNTDSYPNFGSFKHPQQLSKEAFLEKIYSVSQFDDENGVYTYHTVWDLFRDQSSQWSLLAESHIEVVRDAICTFLEDALETLTDSSSYNAILVDVVNPVMEKREADALQVLGHILAPYEQLDPSWFKIKLVQSIEQAEHQKKVEALYEAVRNLPNNRQSTQFDKKLSTVLLTANEASHQHDLGNIPPDDVVNYLKVFYRYQLAAFVENMTSMVVETSLMANLVNIFPATSVPTIDDSSLERLAAESSESQARRTSLGQKLDCLKDSLVICEKNLIHFPRKKSTRRSRNTVAQHKSIVRAGVSNLPEDSEKLALTADHEIDEGEVSDSMSPPQTPALTALIARFGPSTPRIDSHPMPRPSSQFVTEPPVPKSFFTTPSVVSTSQPRSAVNPDGETPLTSTTAIPLETPVAIETFSDSPKTDKETVIAVEDKRGYLTAIEKMKSASSVKFGQTTPLTESPLSKRMNEASLQAASFVKRNYQVFGEALGADASGLAPSAADSRVSVFAKTPNRYMVSENSITTVINADEQEIPTPREDLPTLAADERASVLPRSPDRYMFDEKSIATVSKRDKSGSPTQSRHPPTSVSIFASTTRPQGDVMPFQASYGQGTDVSDNGSSGTKAKLSSVPPKTRTDVFDNLKPFNNAIPSSSPPKQNTKSPSKDKTSQNDPSIVAYHTLGSDKLSFAPTSTNTYSASSRTFLLFGTPTTSNNTTPTQKSKTSSGGLFGFYSKTSGSSMPATSSQDTGTGPLASSSRAGNRSSPSRHS